METSPSLLDLCVGRSQQREHVCLRELALLDEYSSQLVEDEVSPPVISYDKEASFLQHMLTEAGIALPADVNILELATTYRGQFPAMLMKLRISYNMAFPALWKEAFLMQSFSDWWFPSLPAATRQTTAPVISPTPVHFDTSHRMCTLQHILIPTNTPLQPWVSLMTLTRSPPFCLLCRKKHLP